MKTHSLNPFIMLFEECVLLPIWKHMFYFSFYFIMLHFSDFLGVAIFRSNLCVMRQFVL